MGPYCQIESHHNLHSAYFMSSDSWQQFINRVRHYMASGEEKLFLYLILVEASRLNIIGTMEDG